MSRVEEWQARLSAAAERIRATAPRVAPERLTEPNADTGERWDRGQVLAHVTEILPYWVGEVDRIVTAGNGTPFGRYIDDPRRVGTIEQERHTDPARLLERMDEGVAQTQALLARLDERDLELAGEHIRRGRMTVAEIVEEYLVAHLEEHADQLQD